MPERIQRKRTKGWRLPPGAVCVTRPGRWGNPFRVFGRCEYLYCDAGHRRTVLTSWVVFDHGQDIYGDPATPEMAAGHFRRWVAGEFDAAGVVRPCPFTLADVRRELAGRDLACWCPLPAAGEKDVCHAAVLLELAGGGR